MITFTDWVLVLPLLYNPVLDHSKTFVTSTIPYNIDNKDQHKYYKDTIHYNTMTNEELIKENNEKIIQQIYKTLE